MRSHVALHSNHAPAPCSLNRLRNSCSEDGGTCQPSAGAEPALPVGLYALTNRPAFCSLIDCCHFVLTAHSCNSSWLGCVSELTGASDGKDLSPPQQPGTTSPLHLCQCIVIVLNSSKHPLEPKGVRPSQGVAIVCLRGFPQRPSWCRFNFKALVLLRNG